MGETTGGDNIPKSKQCHPWERDPYDLRPYKDTDVLVKDKHKLKTVNLNSRNWREIL
ncbi:hypothetical protein HWN40_00185 [Methanolobus zinderi]|jgi:hypothetical protein|uniref:Uncharacterized protein n=1 Tax=Methanolobus zinderi TaxID=536044 RepID=A0A7D5HZ95_9EURY|nr:hypothetical protein [Methanolobus zinderi]KXS44375.1 MAG: hypothetical protein AWU59_558 [Methanolobus sp. T82-4]QLC48806.1 hypothetical protein HWN40_00185 [Methanolobus zinderi]